MFVIYHMMSSETLLVEIPQNFEGKTQVVTTICTFLKKFLLCDLTHFTELISEH